MGNRYVGRHRCPKTTLTSRPVLRPVMHMGATVTVGAACVAGYVALDREASGPRLALADSATALDQMNKATGQTESLQQARATPSVEPTVAQPPIPDGRDVLRIGRGAVEGRSRQATREAAKAARLAAAQAEAERLAAEKAAAEKAEAERLAAERAAAERAEAERAAAEEAAPARETATTVALTDARKNPRAVARVLVAERGWSDSQFQCLDKLWTKESNWRYTARNPSSGAYGIPQSLPGSKMASAGSDWRTNPTTQIKWGLSYIKSRYGTPCKAWSHSVRTDWY